MTQLPISGRYTRDALALFAVQLRDEVELSRDGMIVVLVDGNAASDVNRLVGNDAQRLIRGVERALGALGAVGAREFNGARVGAHIEAERLHRQIVGAVEAEGVDAESGGVERLHADLVAGLFARQAGVFVGDGGIARQRAWIVQGDRLRVGNVVFEGSGRLTRQQPQANFFVWSDYQWECEVSVQLG